jgi:D-alanyl-D-alanine carboxypeptidase
MNKLLIAIIILCFPGTAKAQNLPAFIDSLVSTGQLPELGFAVVSPDSIMEWQVAGFHRIDLQNEQTKARPSDYFHLGSNTKAITGFVAAYLVEHNKIKWTTPFFELFPQWKDSSHSGYYTMTLTDLLSHRAGVQPYTSGLEYRKLPAFEGTIAERRQQFAKYLLREQPVQNNKVYNYSNAGYSIAALMLEKVAGQPWERLVTDIMNTLVKVDVAFGWPNKIALTQPYGHWMVNNKLVALPPDINYNLALAEPAGDISMSLPSFAKFIQLNLQGLSGKDNVLKASTYEFLHFGLKDYAIGWGNVANDKVKLSEHAGSAGTFYTYTLVDYKKKLAFIIVANSSTQQAQNGIFKLLQAIRTKYSQ